MTIQQIQTELDCPAQKDTLDRMNRRDGLTKFSEPGSSAKGNCCVIAPSNQYYITSAEPDDFAIYTNRNLHSGEYILIDKKAISATLTDRNQLYDCSVLDPDQSSTITKHDHLCHSETPINSSISSNKHLMPDLSNLLQDLLRSYLASPSSAKFHPLCDPLISRWKPDIRIRNPPIFPFSFVKHIQRPIEIMTDLGIDAFADARFDTWVIQQLLYRISSNFLTRHAVFDAESTAQSCSQSFIGSSQTMKSNDILITLGYLFPLFNHSCDPNLEIANLTDGIYIRTRRDITEGEELCVSYIPDNIDYIERTGHLKAWFDECRCPICDAERKVRTSFMATENRA